MRSLLIGGGSLAALLIGFPAMGQQPGDFDVWPDILLASSARGSGYMVNGVGSPAVAYDTHRNRYIMAFEVRLPETDPECPVGMWALGLAFSDDGVTDWRATTVPVVEPQPGTYLGCVAAHPTVMYNENTRTLTIWFKAEQTAPPDPAIGPDRYTGVGRARVRFLPDGGIHSVIVDPDPVLRVDQNFNNPRVIRYRNTYHMAVSLKPDMWTAAGPTADRFTLAPEPALVARGSNPYWAEDELFNASLLCENDLLFPYSVFLGGRTYSPTGSIAIGGWGKSVSSDVKGWFLGATPYFQWRGDKAWRHWDVLRVDDQSGTHYLVYFDEKDEQGRNQIRFASTLPAWNPYDVHSKFCY